MIVKTKRTFIVILFLLTMGFRLFGIPSIDPFFTVRETLRLQSGYFNLKKNDDWIDEVMHNLDLFDKANVNMRALSGGMKRRVLVAQALVHKPPVIILDEPTAGVDVELRQALWQFIGQLNKEGHTIVLTTHYLEEAQAWCNRIAMLKSGQVVALDTTNALIKHASESQLHLKIPKGKIPDELINSIIHHDMSLPEQFFILRIKQYADVENILTILRQNNIIISDMHIKHPDLEDVFMQMMDKQEN